ncbi:unnamed protein product, partial [Brassica oleracea]
MNVVREVPVGTVRVGSWDDIVLCLHTVIGAMMVAMVRFLPKPSPSPTVSASSNNTASPIPPLLPFIYNKNKNLGSIVLMSLLCLYPFYGQ